MAILDSVTDQWSSKEVFSRKNSLTRHQSQTKKASYILVMLRRVELTKHVETIKNIGGKCDYYQKNR